MQASEDPFDFPPSLVDAAAFEEAFGEPLARTLDLETWSAGADLATTYARLEQEVAAAVEQDRRIRQAIRQKVFRRLAEGAAGAFKERGVYRASLREIERVHRGLLFTGDVEACDGISLVYDTLPLTIIQVGVCLASYRGDQGSWVQRMYRRDLRMSQHDPWEEMLEVLERRRRRGGIDAPDTRDHLSELARRGIMAYAERAVLTHKSTARWRMGHGNPAAYELLTGAGIAAPNTEGRGNVYPLLRASLEVLRRLLLEHKRFVFVPSAPSNRLLLSIGQALEPLEYALVDTMEDQLTGFIEGRRAHYPESERRLLAEFAHEAGPQLVIGVYRASPYAPPHIFYTHREHAHEGALIALADSVLQEHRGFPTLIDLADTVCRTAFGVESFLPAVRLAYVEVGEPWRYETERRTRG